jgi:hypothetical protein
MDGLKRMIILAFAISILVIPVGCIEKEDKVSDEGSIIDQGGLEYGTVILSRESVSGFSPLGYHNFIILFDNGHLYQINITNYQPEEKIQNDLSMEQVTHILNTTPTPMNWPLIDLFDEKGADTLYTTKISKFCSISDDDFNDLKKMINELVNSDLEELYSGAGLSCMGWVYFTFKNGTSNTTISCYHNTSGAPDIIKNLDIYLDIYCTDELD